VFLVGQNTLPAVLFLEKWLEALRSSQRLITDRWVVYLDHLVSSRDLIITYIFNIIYIYLYTRWWFHFFYFHPYLGKIPISTNIFQWGCNHQIDIILYILKKKESPKEEALNFLMIEVLMKIYVFFVFTPEKTPVTICLHRGCFDWNMTDWIWELWHHIGMPFRNNPQR